MKKIMRRKKLRTRRLQEMSMDKLIKKAIKKSSYPKVAEFIEDQIDLEDFLEYQDFDRTDSLVSNYREADEILDEFENEAFEVLETGMADDRKFSSFYSFNDLKLYIASLLIYFVGQELVSYIYDNSDDVI